MRLLELEIENWGPHKKMTCDLDSPITGVIGANGKGKSCLLTAISYAITGALPYAKERYIREYDAKNPQRSGKGYAATVRLAFSVGGKKGEVKRVIWDGGTSRELRWDGKVLTRQAEVDGMMEDLMGADKAALQNAVFIQQGELTELIKGTPAIRQETIRRLMNLNFLAARAEDAKAKLRVLELRAAADNSALIEDLEASLKTKREELMGMMDAFAPYEKVLSLQPTFTRWRNLERQVDNLTAQRKAVIAQAEQVNAILASKAQDVPELKERQKGLDARKQMLMKCDDLLLEYLETMKHGEMTLRPKMQLNLEAKKKLAELPYSGQVLQELLKAAEIETELDHLRNDLTLRHAAIKETDEQLERGQKELDSLTTEVTKLEREISKKEMDISGIEVELRIMAGEEDSLRCPVCGTEITKATLYAKYGVAEDECHAYLVKTLDTFRGHLREMQEKLREYDEGVKRAQSLIMRDREERAKLQEQCRIADDGVNRCGEALRALTISPIIREDAAQGCTPQMLKVKLAEMANQEALVEKNVLTTEEETKLLLEIDEVEKKLGVLAEGISHLWEAETGVKTPLPTRAEIEKRQQDIFSQMCANSSKVNEIEQLHAQAKRCEETEKQLTAQVKEIEDGEAKFLHAQLIALKEEEKGLEEAELEFPELWELWSATAQQKKQEIASHRKVIADEEERLARAEAGRQKIARIKEVAEDVRSVVGMLSRDGLPSAFMQAVFEQLTGVISALLSQMGANFTVRVDPYRPCSFLFTTEQGYELPQEALSGGQSVRLALAMLLAAQRLILPEVGLLILDEPTSHVDAEGVENMRTLFSEIAALLQNSGMQLIVVDHNPGLQAGFTKSIIL